MGATVHQGPWRSLAQAVPASMIMPVMHIRIVRVRMLHGLVDMKMGMRFLSVPFRVMVMPVMGIVNMRVFVLQT